MFEYIKHVICLNFVYIGKHLEKLYEIYIFGNSGKYEILRKVPTATYMYQNMSYRLITATTHSFQELYFTGTTSPSKLWPAPPWSSSTKQSARLTTSHHRKSPFFYF